MLILFGGAIYESSSLQAGLTIWKFSLSLFQYWKPNGRAKALVEILRGIMSWLGQEELVLSGSISAVLHSFAKMHTPYTLVCHSQSTYHEDILSSHQLVDRRIPCRHRGTNMRKCRGLRTCHHNTIRRTGVPQEKKRPWGRNCAKTKTFLLSLKVAAWGMLGWADSLKCFAWRRRCNAHAMAPYHNHLMRSKIT